MPKLEIKKNAKKQENVIHTEEKSWSTENTLENVQLSQQFQSKCYKYVGKMKENMLKELKKDMIPMSHQIKTIK